MPRNIAQVKDIGPAERATGHDLSLCVHIVGTIAYNANIPGYVIGKIRIENKVTYVDIPEDLVEQVLKQNGNYRIEKVFVNESIVTCRCDLREALSPLNRQLAR